jgi:hypothetical protein
MTWCLVKHRHNFLTFRVNTLDNYTGRPLETDPNRVHDDDNDLHDIRQFLMWRCIQAESRIPPPPPPRSVKHKHLPLQHAMAVGVDVLSNSCLVYGL